ncbi:O-methyltransferase [Fibrella forsythiae]|uniref:Class I SAM-dependent methyltransferase n=1 Tax=Fibrella forsythiae TaxID=2817061 RepID=A0ABS3JCG4_9BACT|nr:class I SAM-dependent methyltransferase [Fibrella forsythiae]MBO0947690.1 class I SAM-dependent methyltransferase [Fibrella forsythiae]
MNSLRKRQLLELYQTFRIHDAAEPDRLKRWRNLEPESALLLAMLIRTQRAQRVLELGTSNGFSTLWIADALEATNGRLTTIDIDAARTALAQEHLRQFGLADRVECITQDAGLFLAQAEPIYKLIFLDAERPAYVGYLPDLIRLLTQQSGCLLVVDNVRSHADEVHEFITLLGAEPSLMLSTLAVGAGLLLCVAS